MLKRGARDGVHFRRRNSPRRGTVAEHQDQGCHGWVPSEHVVTSLSMPSPVGPLIVYTPEETMMLQHIFLAVPSGPPQLSHEAW